MSDQSQAPPPDATADPSASEQGPSLAFLNFIVLLLYPTIAAQTIILLEAIRTLPAEFRMYRRAWLRKRFNAAEIMFIAIKYMSLFAFICDALIENSSYIKTGEGCYAIHTMYYTFMLMSVSFVAFAIAWRCYIVFNCNRKVLYGLSVGLCCHVALTCWTIRKQHKTTYLEEGFCQIADFDLKSVWTFASPYYLIYNVIYDGAVTAFATKRLLQNAKGLKGMSGITGITRILLYNNIHYVAIVCCINFMEFLYLVCSDGVARSLLGISCAIQIITGIGLLISEQDAVHQGNQSYVTRRSEANSGPLGSNGGGSGGVQLQQSQYASAQTTRSWLPSSLHPRSAEATTSTICEKQIKEYQQPVFHGITLSVHQHCSDATDITDIERGYPNLTGKNDQSSDDISPAAAGWTSTPLSSVNQIQAVEPLFFLPQHRQNLETRPVAYPKLGMDTNPNFSPNKGKMATEDVTLLTRMTNACANDEDGTSLHTKQVHSSQTRKNGGDNLSISSIRAQAQLRKIEAYCNHEDVANPIESPSPFAQTEIRQEYPTKMYIVKRKSVPSIVPERKDSGSGEGPSIFESRLSDKPLPPAYSATDDQCERGQSSGREPKQSMSSPPNPANNASCLSNDEDLSVTTGTFGGRFSATSIKDAEVQRTSNASASRSQFMPLGLALPAMVQQNNRERETVQNNNKTEQNELPSYNLQTSQSVRRIQGSTHNRSFSEGPYRGSVRSNPFFGPSN